jgi:hypothetical protein
MTWAWTQPTPKVIWIAEA